MGRIRLFILGRIVHLYRCRFPVRADGGCADMAARDLRVLQLMTLHLGHIIAKTAVCNLSADTAGHVGGSGRNRGNGFSGKRRSVAGRHASEGPSHKSNTASGAHTGTAFHHSVANIAVAFELAGKPGRKSVGRRSGAGSSRCAAASEYAAGASGPAADAADDPCRHQKLHAHAGTGLGHVKPDRRQIAVKPLGGF